MTAALHSIEHVRRCRSRAARARVLADANERSGGITGIARLLRAMARAYEIDALQDDRRIA